MVTLIVPAAGAKVMVAAAVALVLLMEVAVSVTVRLAGTVAGAVYVTAVLVAPESAPQVGAQLAPDWVSAHDTPRLAGSLATLAVNGCVAEGLSDALVGDIVTEIGAGADAVTVIVAVADLAVLETEVAVKLTVAGLGTLAGAVYLIGVPDALEVADKVPQALPEHPAPDSVQRTPWLLQSWCTVAVKDCVPPPACTLAVVGDTLTVIRDCARLFGAAISKAKEQNVITAARFFHVGTQLARVSIVVSLLDKGVDETGPLASHFSRVGRAAWVNSRA